MATFTVKYRRADGGITMTVIEASSRNDAFAKLKENGIIPISVVNGGSVSTSSSSENTKCADSSKRRFLYTCLIAVMVTGFFVAWILLKSGNENATLNKVEKFEKPHVVKETKNAEPKQIAKKKRIVRNRKPPIKQTVTANTGPLPSAPLIIPPRYGEINGSNIFPRPLFETREENMLAGLISAPPGARVLASGFIPGEEERYRAALESEVKFEERDTEEERELKEFMIDVKKELKEAVANGEKITDIIQQLRDERNALANYRDKLRMNYFILKKEGTPEEAEQYRKESNEILKEYGMQPLHDGVFRGRRNLQ